MDLTFSQFDSPIGPMSILHHGGHIHICEFAMKRERIKRQLERWYKDVAVIDGSLDINIQAVLRAYYEGEKQAIDKVETAARGSEFDKRVWRRLREIPVGKTRSYGMIAAELGTHPRAVGRSNGANPVAVVHPCHRLVGSDGSLTGYAGGLKRKAWLLNFEGASFKSL